MMNKHQAIKIAKDFLKTKLEKEGWFAKVKPFVKAFILYGSVAKETNRPDSDIDILIILPLEQEKRYAKGEYFYEYKGFLINIVLRSIEKLRKIVEEKKDLFQKKVFRKAGAWGFICRDRLLKPTMAKFGRNLKAKAREARFILNCHGKGGRMSLTKKINIISLWLSQV